MFDSHHIASVQPFGEVLQAAEKPYFYTMRFLRDDTSKKSVKVPKGQSETVNQMEGETTHWPTYTKGVIRSCK